MRLGHLRCQWEYRLEATNASQTMASEESKYPAVKDVELRMSYRIARGEQGVLSFEPYKSFLLPLWRFKTPAIARKSADELWERFLAYDAAGDFVGMDMARKFIQMGMTRAKRYANYKGGKKYVHGANGKVQNERGLDHEGKAEKEEASRIFRVVWERCKAHQGYQTKKREFQEEQREWDKTIKKV